jgi:hypothetical protein
VYFKVDTSSFKVDTLPPYDDWIYDFSFTAKQTQNNTDDVLYFIYPDSVCSDKVLTTKFSVSDLNCIPIEFIYASQRNESGQSKILLIDRRNGLSPQQITLETDRICCEETARRFFYAKVVKLSKYIQDEKTFFFVRNVNKLCAMAMPSDRDFGKHFLTFKAELNGRTCWPIFAQHVAQRWPV